MTAGKRCIVLDNESIDSKEKMIKKEEAQIIHSERSDQIHTINQLLRAFSLFFKDEEYIVKDGKVQIVDEHTGRVMHGRRYSDGLHQALEAKEHVIIEKETQTVATITIQNEMTKSFIKSITLLPEPKKIRGRKIKNASEILFDEKSLLLDSKIK